MAKELIPSENPNRSDYIAKIGAAKYLPQSKINNNVKINTKSS